MPDTLAFSLDLLAGAAHQQPPLTVCAAGHLVVQGRSHWQAVRFTPAFTAVICAAADDCTQPSE